jgi:hypothetical protein
MRIAPSRAAPRLPPPLWRRHRPLARARPAAARSRLPRFEAIAAVRVPRWKETALWWPAKKALVVAEVLASNPMQTGGEQEVGMHLFLRPWPPKSLRGFRPEHLLLGHGHAVHGPPAAAGLETAYARARRDLPLVLRKLPGAVRS